MSCAIIAHEQKYNEKIFSIVKRAFDGLPDEIKPETTKNTKYDYVFSKRFDGDILDSSIYVATDVRSGTVFRLHITEAAFIKDYSRIKAGAKQAVPKNGFISEETTANGFNEFFDDFSISEEVENKGLLTDFDYKTYFYAWWENPEYTLPGTMPEILPEDQYIYGNELDEKLKYNLTDGQLLWRRWKINELRQSKSDDGITLNGLQLFRQEYPGNRQEAFQSGAGNVFDVSNHSGKAPLTMIEQMQVVEDQTIREKLKVFQRTGLKIWKLPEKDKKYVIGIDPSGGSGGDPGNIDVWELETLTQVAQLHGQFRPDILAEHAAEIGWFYNEAFIGVENNMLTCVISLSKIYNNYFFETKFDEKIKKKKKIMGWNTNNKTRDPMIDNFVMLWEDGELVINSSITLSEMKTFVTKDNGKREHAVGKQDDALISAMIALKIKDLEPKKARVLSNKPW